MASEQSQAIVIRMVDFSESSLIVTLFSRDFGKLGALAKGARRPKGPFESALDLLSICRIVVIRKSSDALDLLTEAKLQRRFRGSEYGLPQLYAGYYIAELLGELTDLGDPHPELFDVADESLAALAAPGRVGPLVLRFELAALRLLGHAPSLHHCAGTGVPVKLEGRVPFSVAAGGVIAPDVRPPHGERVLVSAEAIKTMETFLEPGDAWREIELTPKLQGEIRRVQNAWLYWLLGKKPRMHEYLPLISS